MKIPEEAMQLKIFISENDKYKSKPLYEQIVLEARSLGLAGATVTRGILGFGANSHIHSSKVLRLSDDLPVIIGIVDAEENLNKIIPFLDLNVTEGLITVEKVRVIKYKSKK